MRAYGKVSKEVLIKNGAWQRNVLAATLFNFFFDTVTAMAMTRHPGCGLKVLYNQEAELVGSRMKMSRELSLYDLEHADDMALISDWMDMLEEVFRAMEVSCSEMVLTISSKRRRYLLSAQLAGLPTLEGMSC